MTASVGIGIIGVGRMGSVHARNLALRIPEANLLAIADINPETACSVAAECRVEEWTTDYHELLVDDRLRGIVIASSTDTHATMVREAAEAGKAVFCEKPLDLRLERVDDALDAVRRTGVAFQIGFHRRFDPSIRKAEDLLRAGAIGKPYLLKLTSRDPHPAPREYIAVSGGLYLDTTVHDFDAARFLMGCEIVEVSTVGASLVDEMYAELGDVDTAVTSLRFANGALGVIDNCRQATYGHDIRVEIHGSAGSIVVGNTPQTAVEQYSQAGLKRDVIPHWFLERFEQAYVDELRHFVQCILKNEIPLVGGADGKRAVELGLAAWTSLRERRPVRV